MQKQRDRVLPILTCLQKRNLIWAEFIQHEIERNWSAKTCGCHVGLRLWDGNELTKLIALWKHHQARKSKRYIVVF